MAKVVAACQKYGKTVAIPAIAPADAIIARDMGLRILVGGSDAYYLRAQNKVQLDGMAAVKLRE
ncbi:hypothetical protein D3C83_281820 [compost metagenome]